jgi:hypothetical protein
VSATFSTIGNSTSSLGGSKPLMTLIILDCERDSCVALVGKVYISGTGTARHTRRLLF